MELTTLFSEDFSNRTCSSISSQNKKHHYDTSFKKRNLFSISNSMNSERKNFEISRETNSLQKKSTKNFKVKLGGHSCKTTYPEPKSHYVMFLTQFRINRITTLTQKEIFHNVLFFVNFIFVLVITRKKF